MFIISIWDSIPIEPAQNLPIKIQFTDEAHRTFFDSTDYTEGVPVVDVATNGSQSKYINLNTAGKVGNLRIEIAGDEVSYPVYLDEVLINVPRPFSFNTTRFLAVLLVISVVYLFRPGIGYLLHRYAQKSAALEGGHCCHSGRGGGGAFYVLFLRVQFGGCCHFEL